MNNKSFSPINRTRIVYIINLIIVVKKLIPIIQIIKTNTMDLGTKTDKKYTKASPKKYISNHPNTVIIYYILCFILTAYYS